MRENTVMINNELIHVKKYQGQNVVTFRDIDQCHKRTSGTATVSYTHLTLPTIYSV